jgi:hypothetical protein
LGQQGVHVRNDAGNRKRHFRGPAATGQLSRHFLDVPLENVLAGEDHVDRFPAELERAPAGGVEE